MKHQLGLTLLEVSIALSIGMAILLMATKSVGYLIRYNATHEVKSEVALLRLALEDYYFNNCAKEDFPQPTIDILKRDKYLPAQFNADNGFGSEYKASFDIDGESMPPTYTITLPLNIRLDADVYRRRLGAASMDDGFKIEEYQLTEFMRDGTRKEETYDPSSFELPDNLGTGYEPRTSDKGRVRETVWSYNESDPESSISTRIIVQIERYHKNLYWTYPLLITRQYHDRSLGRFKRFYGEKLC